MLDMKKTMLIVTIFTIVVFLFASGNVVAAQSEEKIVIATSAIGGSWYILGGAFATLINNNVDWIGASTTIGSSIENVVFTGKGDIQLAFTYTNDAYFAYTGVGGSTDGTAYKNLRSVMGGHQSNTLIMVREDSDMYNIKDFKGKRIAIGPIGSGVNFISQELFAFYGLERDKDWEPTYLSHPDGCDALSDGTVDVLVANFGMPSATHMNLASTANIRFIETPYEDLVKLQETHPYWFPYKIEAGMYRGQDKAIWGLGTTVQLITHKDVSEDVIYEFVRTLYDNPEFIMASHAGSGKYYVPEYALTGVQIPYHPGAIKALKEYGVEVPEKLIP